MKKIILLLLFSLRIIFCPAQKNDNTWIFGYYYSPVTPVCGLDFYFGAPDTVGFNPPFNFIAGGDACMSDNTGNILFYTNGTVVADWNNQIMQNSIGFNIDTSFSSYVNDLWQGVIALPSPDHPQQYVLFHLCGVFTSNWLYPLKLFYSVIDMSQNGGSGSMILKNQVAFADTLLPCAMQATKHGNGRDWWIINKRANSNAFHITLLTPDGIFQDNVINTGHYVSVFNISEGQSNFSPDGSLYAMTYNTDSSLYLYDFDRCSGVITFRDSIRFIPTDANEWPVWGCSFSPNSRYLYATTNNDLYQFDMQVPSLGASQIHIADHDGFDNYFFRHALGPDGKIYMTSWGGTLYLHVINDPDIPDTLCNFGQHQLQLISYHSSTLPEFPNYRLGALSGSPCDSITSINDLTQNLNHQLKVIPNPNNGEFMISYNLAANTEGKLKIINILGEKIFEKTLPRWSIQQHISLLKLPIGVYLVRIENNNSSFSSNFVVKE